MNNFKKAAVASALLSLASTSFQVSAVNISNEAGNVILGCAVPANSTAGATVYSIDSYDDNGAINTGFPSWLKAGASCSRAINWVLTAADTTGIELQSATNQAASGGYTLQSFVFGPSLGNAQVAIAAPTDGAIALVGCAAPSSGTAGAPIYSVDGQNSSAGTAVSGVTFAALNGNPCSSAISLVQANGGGGTLNGAFNARTIDGAYSLQQYIVQ